MQRNELVTAYFNQGNDSILTSIVGVDPDLGVFYLDPGPESALNKKMLDSRKVIFVTTQDKVRVQFAVEAVEYAQLDRHSVFRMALPTALLKLQKREYYRLDTPIANPLKCVIPLAGGKKMELDVADISIGGIGVISRGPDTELLPDKLYLGCRIDLPDIGTLVANIKMCATFDVTLNNGSKNKRVGCQFVNIPGSMQAMVQRYIIKLDRDRRAKEAR